jgi:hypothetical protein
MPDEVSRSVQDAANVLGQRIWSTGAQPRSHLLRGINPPDAERYLSHAVAQGWVVVDGGLVIRGAVNPVPLPEPVLLWSSGCGGVPAGISPAGALTVRYLFRFRDVVTSASGYSDI